MLLIEVNDGKEQACFAAKDVISVIASKSSIQIRLRNHTSSKDFFNLAMSNEEKAKACYQDILEILREA